MRKYMDREEMISRVEEGEYPLDIAIDKWKRAIPAIKKDLNLNWWFSYHCLDDSCALCHVYRKRHKNLLCEYTCGNCPIKPKDKMPCSVHWAEASYACLHGDRNDFMLARKALILEMKKAHAKNKVT